MVDGYKIKSIIKKKDPLTPEQVIEREERARRKNLVYKITCRCFNCGQVEKLRAEEPTPIEYLLPGWVSFNAITDRDEMLVKYSCPACVDKLGDPNVPIENINIEHDLLYK